MHESAAFCVVDVGFHGNGPERRGLKCFVVVVGVVSPCGAREDDSVFAGDAVVVLGCC